MIQSRIQVATYYVLLALFTAVVYVPLVGFVLISLRPDEALGVAFDPSEGLHFESFVTAWNEAGLGSALTSSFIVATLAAVLGGGLSVLAGYALGTLRFTGQTVLRSVFLVGLMVPIEATIIPLFYWMRWLGLVNTYQGVILPFTGFGLAFGAFWMRAYFTTVPREIVDAARVDGASSWATLWRILVPAGRPAILTLVMLLFVFSWNDFFISLVILQTGDPQTAQLALSDFVSVHEFRAALIAAGAILAAVPVVLLYLATQRGFIRGVLSGAVKE